MFILRDLLRPLQAHFSDTDLGRERASLLAYTLLAVIVPFTSSMTSNLLRSLVTLFGIDIKKKRFYTFMASSTLPWHDGVSKPALKSSNKTSAAEPVSAAMLKQ
jgi:hypothetical protein